MRYWNWLPIHMMLHRCATCGSENADDAEQMGQHIVSKDGATRASENTAGAARMLQQRASTDEVVCVSENSYDHKQMIQRRVSRDGSTRASENAAHDE